MLCCIFCVSFAFGFLDVRPNMVPVEKVLDAAVCPENQLRLVFQRQSSVIIPSFLSLLLYLTALSLCIKRARYLKAL